MYLLWKKSRQKDLKVDNYSATVAAADGSGCEFRCGPPQINQAMRNTGGCRTSSKKRVGRREIFYLLFDRGWFHYFRQIKKKSVRG